MNSEYRKLGELVLIVKGKKHNNVFDAPIKNSKRYIQIDDLRNNDNPKYTTDEGVEVNNNDIIIAWDGANAGTIGFNISGYIGSTLARLRLKTTDIYPKYLGRYLRGNSSHIRQNCYGATIPHVSKSFLESIKIPLPPLTIQKKIAGVLERADAAREKRRQANTLTEQFLQSVFLKMFGDPVRNPKGWVVRKLKEVALIERDSILPAEVDVNTIYIGLEHIEKDTGKLLHYEVIKNIELKSNKFRFTKNHVLYGKLRPYLNKVCIPKIDGVCSTDILPIMPISDLTNRYFLAYLMKQRSFIEKATIQSSGANLPRISPNTLNDFQVYLPPFEKQKKFGEIVEKIEFIHGKQDESEKYLEKLFQSLMQKAFKGELKFKEKPITRKEKELSPTDRHAGILCLIISIHQKNERFLNTLGEVKGEKIAHLIENRIAKDLGRNPIRDAAGPDDYPHLQKVYHRAKKRNWFFTKQRTSGVGIQYVPGENINYIIDKVYKDIGNNISIVERVINLFLDKKTQFAEIAATLYAAWNDLLLDGKNPTDEEIVYEARDNWSEEKLKIERSMFFKMINWLRENDLVPEGKGKRTIKKQ